MTVVVPREFRDALKILANATAAEWSTISANLTTLDVATGSGALVKAIRSGLEDRSIDVGRLVTVIINTYNEADADEIEAESLANEVAAQCPGENGDLKNSAQLIERLTTIYKMHDRVGAIAKTTSVLLDRHNTYCSSRILTDIRPIFVGSDPPKPMCFAAIHTLKLSAHEAGGNLRDFHFALTPTHLAELAKHIARAESKAKEMRSNLSEISWIEE